MNLVIGTAQWGANYGISNRIGKPDLGEVARILDVGRANSISVLDTARAYGDSEEVIGELTSGDTRWQVMTKIDPGICEPDLEPAEVRRRTRQSIATSLESLRRRELDVVLLHRAAHRTVAEGAAWSVLRDLRGRGLIGAIGLSIAVPAEVDLALEDPEVEVLQVPTSLFDQRLVRRGFFEAAQERRIRVFARSIFLQGAAFLRHDELPGHLHDLGPYILKLSTIASQAKASPAALCLAYALSLPVAGVVVGIEQAIQLEQIVEMRRQISTLSNAARLAADAVPQFRSNVLEPFRWPKLATPDPGLAHLGGEYGDQPDDQG